MEFGRLTVPVTCMGIAVCAVAAYVTTTGLAPLFVLALSLGVVVVALWKWARLPLLVVGIMAMLAGYILLNRNFASLHIPAGRLPIYVGELLLGCGLVWVAWHWVQRDMRRVSGFLVALGAWLLYATARFLAGGLDYGIDGIRDFALAYYALFAVVGYVIWPAVPRSRWTIFFALLFGAAIPVAAYVVAFGPFGLPIPSDDPTADNNVGRADVMAVALIGAATYFLLALRDTRARRQRGDRRAEFGGLGAERRAGGAGPVHLEDRRCDARDAHLEAIEKAADFRHFLRVPVHDVLLVHLAPVAKQSVGREIVQEGAGRDVAVVAQVDLAERVSPVVSDVAWHVEPQEQGITVVGRGDLVGGQEVTLALREHERLLPE